MSATGPYVLQLYLHDRGMHTTPASSMCWQLLTPQGLCLHAPRAGSSPKHVTSSSQITEGVVLPNADPGTVTAVKLK